MQGFGGGNDYQAFLLIPKHEISEKGEVLTSGYIIGPCYRRLWEDDKMNFLIEINNKKVYFLSDVNSLMEPHNLSEEEMQALPDEKDNKTNEPVWVNYVRHAIYIHYIKSELLINSRPDTLFLPHLEKDERFIND